MESRNTWMKTRIIELLNAATDEELSNVWFFVNHRIPVREKKTEAARV